MIKIRNIFVSFLMIESLFASQNLISSFGKIKNKPPYVNNANIIAASFPSSTVKVSLNAVDPEHQGVYANLITSSPGDGITCEVKNAIQIVCHIPNITLKKTDKCSINAVQGKQSVPYCKSYTIKYYLKDNGYESLPSAQSSDYTITLRVAKEINGTLNEDYRASLNSLKDNFAITDYNKNTVANILPDSMQKQYNFALETNDKSKLFDNNIKSNSNAVNAMGNAVSGTNNNELLNDADSITSISSFATNAPVFCTIKRAGFIAKSAYVCSLDPNLEISSNVATQYEYNPNDITSQNNALSQCQDSCEEKVNCNNVSGDKFYTLIKDKNYITQNIANVNKKNLDDNVKSLVINKENPNNGNIINTITIPLNSTGLTLKDFYWETSNNGLNTERSLTDNLTLKCAFRSKLDIKTTTDYDNKSFYVIPQSTCYIKYNNSTYPQKDDSYLYTFKLKYYKTQFMCPIDGETNTYSSMDTCRENCFYQGKCIIVKTPFRNQNEHIINNCRDVVLTNGQLLSDAVAQKKCKLYKEVSIDENGHDKETFVESGAIVNPLRDDIGFSESNTILKKENAIAMLGSFINMITSGEDEQRVGKVVSNTTFTDFDGNPVNSLKPYITVPSIYKISDKSANSAIMLKINPTIVNSAKNASYADNNYSIIPILMLVNDKRIGEVEKYLKTYYLLNLNSDNLYVNEYKHLAHEAMVKDSDSDYSINPDYYIYKLSDGTWGLTYEGYLSNKNLINKLGIRYTILQKDKFLNKNASWTDNSGNIWSNAYYFILPYDKTIVGVSSYSNLESSYEDYLNDKDNYSIKDRNFSKYSIKMTTDIDFDNVYTSTATTSTSNESITYKGKKYHLITIGDKEYIDKNNDNSLDEADKYPLEVTGWYFNIATITNDPKEWKSDYNPLFGERITENDVIGKNWSDTSGADFGGGIYSQLNYPVKMKFSWKGDDYHIGIAVYNNNTKVGCYKKNVGNSYKCGKNLPYYGDFQSRTSLYSSSNALEDTGNYFIMFNRDGGRGVDHRDYIRVDFETTKTTPPFKYAIPKNPVYCPSGFNNDNGYCYKSVTAHPYTSIMLPIEEESGTNYNPNNLTISNVKYKWTLNPKLVNLSNYLKTFNLWAQLRGNDVLNPIWIGKIDFNTFNDGKLFFIFAKTNDIKNILSNIQTNGVKYLTNLLESDYTGNKKYLAWEMNKRYNNSIIYNGGATYSGFDAYKINTFLRMFGLHQYNTLCPTGFYYSDFKCINQGGLIAAAFPDYFTNQVQTKDGPLYASFEKGNLFVKAVPPFGDNILDSSIQCPLGYYYNNTYKDCEKNTELKNCSAPNGSYDFSREVCLASPTCTNNGFFDANSGKCIKLTPTNYSGENGYYFLFQDNPSNYNLYTPLSLPQKYQCVFNKYKCSLDSSIYNSQENCEKLCYKEVGNSKTYGSCSFVSKQDKDTYNFESDCKYHCKSNATSFKSNATLEIKSNSPFNKYSYIDVYKNNTLINSGTTTSNNNLYIGSNGTLSIDSVSPGDTIKIVLSSKYESTQYVTGMGFWNDNLGDKTVDAGTGIKCYELDKYFPMKNQLVINLDVDHDGSADASVSIPTFYCVSNNSFEKDIIIKVLGNKLQVNYFTSGLDSKTKNSNISYNNYGECVPTANNNASYNLLPFFEKDIPTNYLSNVSILKLATMYPDNTVKGIKDNNVNQNLINRFYKHFCHYPMQEEYEAMKEYPNTSLSDLFPLYKYFDECPSYYNKDEVKFLNLSSSQYNNKATYELGTESISKSYLNLDGQYNPKQIYTLLNKKHITTLPAAKGVFTNDNFFLKVPNVSTQSNLEIGYGYSPFKDCRNISGVSAVAQASYADKTNCRFTFGTWEYDSSLKKCIKSSSENGCNYGQLVSGKCELDPICPNGYQPGEGNKCIKYIVQTYSTNRKICKPWWTLKREYTCKVTDNLGSFIFGLPRWLSIKKVPVYYYKDYNFSN